jgi:hypothetical protein
VALDDGSTIDVTGSDPGAGACTPKPESPLHKASVNTNTPDAARFRTGLGPE